MDDSLERDQLNLWEKLNLLYGEEAGENNAPEDAGQDSARAEEAPEAVSEPLAEAQEPADDPGSASLEEVEQAPRPDGVDDDPERINEVCVECRYDCKQKAVGFVISRCRLANESLPENHSVTMNQAAASAGSMGIEKINETCRRCRRSCKQRSSKLNKMLCLGFVPLDNGQSEHD